MHFSNLTKKTAPYGAVQTDYKSESQRYFKKPVQSTYLVRLNHGLFSCLDLHFCHLPCMFVSLLVGGGNFYL